MLCIICAVLEVKLLLFEEKALVLLVSRYQYISYKREGSYHMFL